MAGQPLDFIEQLLHIGSRSVMLVNKHIQHHFDGLPDSGIRGIIHRLFQIRLRTRPVPRIYFLASRKSTPFFDCATIVTQAIPDRPKPGPKQPRNNPKSPGFCNQE